MKLKNFLLIGILFVLTGCLKELEHGTVVFFTNIQALTNCGPFNVYVHIDNGINGTLSEPFLPIDSVPSCHAENTSSVLVIQMDAGTYNYSVSYDCSGLEDQSGSFEVKGDSCTVVYL